MKLLQTETLQGAREKLLEYLKKKRPETEHVELMDSEGKVLAEDVLSACAIPDFSRSTVDGYAVLAQDTQGASESIPVFLDIVEEVNIGHPATSCLRSGQCAYVPTGGMVPKGADAMVMVEYCELFDDSNVAIYDSVSRGRNLVGIGEDIEKDSVIVKKGTKIRPQEIGALASIGVSNVLVYKPIRITIISTGDELVSLEETPALGQIRDINTYALESLAKRSGFEVVATYVLKDEEELLRSAISEGLKTSQLVVVSGGSSQGKKDMTAKLLDELSAPGVFVHGISIKPGKPTIVGYDQKSHTGLLGLPGHPVAAMLIFKLIAEWVKNSLLGQNQEKCVYARMETNLSSSPGKTTCQMMRLIEEDGGYLASPIFGKSGLMSTLTAADGYTIIDMNKEGLQKGELVKVWLI
jgi:molybdopterin molybdotransferase